MNKDRIWFIATLIVLAIFMGAGLLIPERAESHGAQPTLDDHEQRIADLEAVVFGGVEATTTTSTTSPGTTTTTSTSTTTTTSPPPPSGTIVVTGFSQTSEWGEALPSQGWDVVWKSGAGLNAWRNRTSDVWSLYDFGSITGPIVSTLSSTTSDWQAALAQIKSNFDHHAPNHSVLYFQPVVGSDDPTMCAAEGKDRSPRNHAEMWPEMVAFAAATPGVEAIYHPHINTCSDYRDTLGHLSASTGIRQQIAAEVVAAYGGS